MDTWYVRDRGRVIGPFTREQLLGLVNRQLHRYHEVSQDQVTWRAAGLVPGLFPNTLAPADPLPIGVKATVTTADSPQRSPDFLRRSYPRSVYIASGVLLAIALLAVFFIVVKPFRSAGSSPQAGEGPITLSPGIDDQIRRKFFRDCVCLVVPGREIKQHNGLVEESFFLPKSVYEDKEQDKVKAKMEGAGMGSGFVINSEGYILTNRHVTEDFTAYKDSELHKEYERAFRCTDRPKIWVFFGHEGKCEAELVIQSKDYDFSILKIVSGWEGKHYFALCDTAAEEYSFANGLSALGFPAKDRKALNEKDAKERLDRLVTDDDKIRFNYLNIREAFQEKDFNLSVTQGSITKDAEKEKMDRGLRECYIVRHSAPISSGNSGGPLLAKDGTVIGINTWVFRQNVLAKAGKDGKDLKEVEINDPILNFALCIQQLKPEIDKYVRGVNWRPMPKN